jgi:hypothetical protein
MANEISFTAKLTVTKNSASVTQNTSTKTQTMSTTSEKLHHTIQDVGTSAEDLSTGDVDLTKEYLVLLYNRDATNYVDVICRKDGTPTDVTVGRMRPGEPFGPFRATLQTAGYPKLRLQANTAACDVEVTVTDAGDPAT